MKRCLVVCLTAVLACAAPALQAQVNTRAYAPENLRTLSVNDQQRVIAQEYAEQSNGRRIPDDQMRFYLDQVNRSNWGFSRIKQDIATSLRGNGGWNGGGGSPWPGTSPGHTSVVRCESNDNRQRSCPTGWSSARLSRQLSNTRCIEGRNWGSRNGSVWVSGGCRAEFVQGRGGWGGGGGGGNYTVTCSSTGNRTQTCAWDGRQGRPVLIEQLSGSPCVQGRTWVYRGGSIAVSNGCRARFGVR